MASDDDFNSESSTDEELALILYLKQRKKATSTRFNFDAPDLAPEWKLLFRFTKPQIEELANLLEIPNPYITSSRHSMSSIEALCILLRRLAYPNRLSDISRIFGRSTAALSVIVNEMIDFIYDNWKHLLTWDRHRLTQEKLQHFADSVFNKNAPLTSVIGFIDGTVRGICRPGTNQKVNYNGHKVPHLIF